MANALNRRLIQAAAPVALLTGCVSRQRYSSLDAQQGRAQNQRVDLTLPAPAAS